MRLEKKRILMLHTSVLMADEWTPQSGLVTAAQKLQCKGIAQKYSAEIPVRFFLSISSLSCMQCRVVI
jgi:hypothetical protein